ncbi:DUF2663 family protein [Paenibacillus sp. N3.4]|uniref:DUF2663 family protein n=1 Tax=Paenibacillus sp. N3.4 TaxID=2603222 RepID=UPI00164F045F|nr:DUF2663 family protein [Paenibacillus sp. N3.4]
MHWPELNLSDDTIGLLKELQERKQKWDKLKSQQPLYAILTGGLGFFCMVSFYKQVLVNSDGNAMKMIDLLISNTYLCYMILVCISLFVFTRNRMTQTEKAKTKYENLRMETIDRLDASWLCDVKSESRDQISSFLQKEYDINVIYKS